MLDSDKYFSLTKELSVSDRQADEQQQWVNKAWAVWRVTEILWAKAFLQPNTVNVHVFTSRLLLDLQTAEHVRTCIPGQQKTVGA